MSMYLQLSIIHNPLNEVWDKRNNDINPQIFSETRLKKHNNYVHVGPRWSLYVLIIILISILIPKQLSLNNSEHHPNRVTELTTVIEKASSNCLVKMLTTAEASRSMMRGSLNCMRRNECSINTVIQWSLAVYCGHAPSTYNTTRFIYIRFKFSVFWPVIADHHFITATVASLLVCPRVTELVHRFHCSALKLRYRLSSNYSATLIEAPSPQSIERQVNLG